MAAVKNSANAANTVKVMDKLSKSVFCDAKVMAIEPIISVKIDQNKISFCFKILRNIVAGVLLKASSGSR